MGVPVMLFHFSATAFWVAMPPPRVSLSELKSTVAKSGWFTMPLNRVLTPTKTLTHSFFMSPIKLFMSRGLVIRMILEPAWVKIIRFTVSAKMW